MLGFVKPFEATASLILAIAWVEKERKGEGFSERKLESIERWENEPQLLSFWTRTRRSYPHDRHIVEPSHEC